jgi:hypothetical protein
MAFFPQRYEQGHEFGYLCSVTHLEDASNVSLNILSIFVTVYAMLQRRNYWQGTRYPSRDVFRYSHHGIASNVSVK